LKLYAIVAIATAVALLLGKNSNSLDVVLHKKDAFCFSTNNTCHF
jgi:hypothetical protein